MRHQSGCRRRGAKAKGSLHFSRCGKNRVGCGAKAGAGSPKRPPRNPQCVHAYAAHLLQPKVGQCNDCGGRPCTEAPTIRNEWPISRSRRIIATMHAAACRSATINRVGSRRRINRAGGPAKASRASASWLDQTVASAREWARPRPTEFAPVCRRRKRQQRTALR